MTTSATNYATPLYDVAAQLSPGELVPFPPAVMEGVPTGCLLDAFGIVGTHIGPGACRGEMAVADLHLNPRGVMQGGAVVALADAVAGWATYAAVPPGGRFTTLELKANLLGAARSGDLVIAMASPVHLGRTTIVLRVEVYTADQEERSQHDRRLLAAFSCTQLVLPA